MEIEQFERLLECLTGTPVKDLSASERQFLSVALSNDNKAIGWSQFNELLLIANKDRVERPFFQYFFCPGNTRTEPKCQVRDIVKGVERFQKAAMLCFGNFIYAYRRLSRLTTETELRRELLGYCRDPKQLIKRFRSRKPKVLEIERVPRDETYLMGYLSASEVVAEHARASRLHEVLDLKDKRTWRALERAITSGVADLTERQELSRLISKFRKRTSRSSSPDDLQETIRDDLPLLDGVLQKLRKTQAKGEKNTDVYLTWDHMDIYFATSMRKRWEYEDLYDFVSDVMREKQLQTLNVRHFDPTQSFEKNRIDKGLIESLMLKRAACTVYSVQDTDTLGKDSELAATLAQGKPVIAYAPNIDVNRRVKQLIGQRPVVLKERLQFVHVADEGFTARFANQIDFINNFVDRINAFEEKTLWKSISDPDEVAKFTRANLADLKRFCRIIADSEKEIYNKRAQTLQKHHPLAIQVNLDTGVANGVLVARDTQTCVELLFRILTNQLEFNVKEDQQTNCWLLVERLTESVFRVVTKDRKLTNCFWNFYRRERGEEDGPEN